MDATFSNVTARTQLTGEEMNVLVEKKLVELTAQAQPFSAWQVTQSIRNDEPSIEIAHNDVKWRVHEIMAKLCAIGEWDKLNIGYWLYGPVAVDAGDGDADSDESAGDVDREENEDVSDEIDAEALVAATI